MFQVIGCLVNKVASSSIVKVMFVTMTLAMVTIMLTIIFDDNDHHNVCPPADLSEARGSGGEGDEKSPCLQLPASSKVSFFMARIMQHTIIKLHVTLIISPSKKYHH